MKQSNPGIAATAMIAALLLSACGGAVSDEHEINDPVAIQHLEGTDVARVTLTARAAQRLDIQTAPVEMEGSRMVIPSAAWFVQPDGTFWVYTSPEPLVFIRHKINVEHDDGARTFLTEGPAPGTRVVTVGVPELLGAEFEIGH
jgi:hypothetical protein